MDMAVLVDAQGDMLNNIESQVKKTRTLHAALSDMMKHTKEFCI